MIQLKLKAKVGMWGFRFEDKQLYFSGRDEKEIEAQKDLFKNIFLRNWDENKINEYLSRAKIEYKTK